MFQKKWENTRIEGLDQDLSRNTNPGQTETEGVKATVEKGEEEMIAEIEITEDKINTEEEGPGPGLEKDPEMEKSTGPEIIVMIAPGIEENTRRARNPEDILAAVILLVQTLTPSVPMILQFLLLN